MLTITIPEQEIYDEASNTFIAYGKQTLNLEHSLVSLSKWESKWCKPFLSKDPKTFEETIDYIRCMTINNVNPDVYKLLTNNDIKTINDYIESPMTATWFSDKPGLNGKPGSHETVTSELIYYWMVALTIPFECQKWHLNRLLTLIKVCNIKNAPPKKMSKSELMARNKSLNAARRSALNSKG